MGTKDVQAVNVARAVLGKIGKGEKVNITKTATEHGLSWKYANSGQVQKTQAYQSIINPVVKKWESIRDKMTKELENKDLTFEKASDLVSMVDKLTHNIQLLSGNSTENVAVVNVTEQYNELINKVKGDS